MSIINELNVYVAEMFAEYNKKVAARFGIPFDELQEWVQSGCGGSATTTVVPKTVVPVSSSETCPFLLQRGNRKGEICGGKSMADKVYCSRHKKSEGSSTPKKSIAPKKAAAPAKPSDKVVLRKHPLSGKTWHPETKMVFDPKTRMVIGKMEKDVLVKLTEADLVICRARKFAYTIPAEPEEEPEEPEVEEVEVKTEPVTTATNATTTHLTLSTDAGVKFWELVLNDAVVTVRYGKEGSQGTSKSKTYPTSEKAAADAVKQIALKRSKGYKGPEMPITTTTKPSTPIAKRAKALRTAVCDVLEELRLDDGALDDIDNVGEGEEEGDDIDLPDATDDELEDDVEEEELDEDTLVDEDEMM